MAVQGYAGVSFPFRIGIKGGVVMSTTTADDPTHIVEAIEQILTTAPMERGMEYHFKSDIDYNVFDVNDSSTHTLIEYQAGEALRLLEDRIEVLHIDVRKVDSRVYLTVYFKMVGIETTYQTKVRLGGVLD